MPDKIISVLQDAQSIVISTHTRPDGDAIGSQLALGLFLRRVGKNVLLLNSDPTPYNMEWLNGADLIQTFDGSLSQLESVQQADAVVVVDTNGQNRMGEVGLSLRNAPGKKLLIDHHTDAEDWFDESWSRETASSAGQLVYEILSSWNSDEIDRDIAEALYVAIMTDTGSFRYSHVTPELHRMIAQLIQQGDLDVSKIYGEVYETRSPESIRLLSRVLSTLEMWHGGRVGTMAISRTALRETGAAIAEADGFVNHVLTLDGVSVAVMFTETARGTKASFRSKEDFEVNKWAASFGGGGHKHAAGAFLKERLEPAMRRVMNAAARFLPAVSSVDDSSEGMVELGAEDAALLESLTKMRDK